jgi:hypothetical protein
MACRIALAWSVGVFAADGAIAGVGAAARTSAAVTGGPVGRSSASTSTPSSPARRRA